MDGGITGGHAAGERVVPDVERDEAGQLREPDGDGAEEGVEAEVEAREQRQVAEAGRDGAVEAVGLQGQHGEPGEVAQLRGDAPGEVVVAELHHCTAMDTSTSAALTKTVRLGIVLIWYDRTMSRGVTKMGVNLKGNVGNGPRNVAI